DSTSDRLGHGAFRPRHAPLWRLAPDTIVRLAARWFALRKHGRLSRTKKSRPTGFCANRSTIRAGSDGRNRSQTTSLRGAKRQKKEENRVKSAACLKCQSFVLIDFYVEIAEA